MEGRGTRERRGMMRKINGRDTVTKGQRGQASARHERLEYRTDGWRRLRCLMPPRPRTGSSQRVAGKKAASKAKRKKH